MRSSTLAAALLLAAAFCCVRGQRITTIQLDGVQYFVSRMNPYSPALNYFLAYQYCRSLGLQLASFETKEKADSITEYLSNAGYSGYDFWTSGNRLGRDMFLWMSTGLPFNVTFNYMREAPDDVPPTLIGSGPVGEEDGLPPAPDAPEHDDAKSRGRQLASKDGSCVMLSAPDLKWDVDDCNLDKHFICEQTRCYYYNYGSIPVSASQGNNKRPAATTTTTPPTTTTTPAAATVPEEEEEDSTAGPTTTSTTSTPPSRSAPNFKVNRRITLRPLHFPNLGSLLSSPPWGSVPLSPSPVYHHGKRIGAEESQKGGGETTTAAVPTTAAEALASFARQEMADWKKDTADAAVLDVK